MNNTGLENWAREEAKKAGFEPGEIIYQADYYETGKERNIIFSGTYQDTPTVFKAYDDPRLTDEPISLKNFLASNKSELLRAPELYDYKMITPKKGWLIMERLPSDGYFLKSPLNTKQRKIFLSAFQEYLENWPSSPTRELTIIEQMSAFTFHQYRINQWLALAIDKEERNVANGKARMLQPDRFIRRYKKGLSLLWTAFEDGHMHWCHGHVKPKEIFVCNKSKLFYLTDFAHAKKYPMGYEYAFIIWADHLMAADWTLDYRQWRKGVLSWTEDLRPIGEDHGIVDFVPFIKICLIERILGAILADICASDRPEEEKASRLNLLYNLFDELVS